MSIFSLLWIVGCASTEENPRHIYNEGTVALNEVRYEEASKLLLDARDQAKGDAELRQFSAYNLALSYARSGIQLEQEDPQKASEEYSRAVTWFRDAVQLNPEDVEARANLEMVLKRIQLLADVLNAGTNSLEKRLDRLLEDTRTLRDQVRSLDVAIAGGQEVSSLQRTFEQLAIEVRSLQADASTTIQLASNEKSNIETKREEERTDEEKMRLAQLTALTHHLEQGRDQIADGRRVLRRLDVHKSLERMDKAVKKIHRAREQLLDPLVVLQSLSQEEGQLSQQTMAIAMNDKNQISLGEQTKAPQLPSWFDAEFLANEQSYIHERADEIAQRFQFATAESSSEEKNPEQAEFMALLQDALPYINNAVAMMKNTEQSLRTSQFLQAMQQEYQVQQELAKAIERFADAKNIIELSYQTQQALVALLTPPKEGEELPADLSPEQRLEAIQRGLEENVSRIQRLQGALLREKNKQVQQAAQASEGGGEEASAEVEQLFTKAEELRGNVETSLQKMQTELLLEEGDVLIPALEAEKNIQELRILFFSIVEHLKLLLEEQNALRDETATVIADEYERMRSQLPWSIAQQEQLSQKSQAIAEVLQQQSDAIAESDQEKAGALAEAYGHTSAAQSSMQEAIDLLQQVQAEEGGVSHDPEPVLEYQQQSVEAIMAAIQALQPPQKDKNEEQNQNEQEQQEQMSRQQAEKRLQAAREREAERAKKQNAAGSEPVEKDW